MMLVMGLWYFLLGLRLLEVASQNHTIRKCCPEGQRLNLTYQCIDYEDTRDDLSWFPVELIVNRTTLQHHKHHQDKYLKMLQKKYGVKYESPECAEGYQSSYAPYAKGKGTAFRFLLNEDLTMEVHVSTAGSGREEDEKRPFPTISSNDQAAVQDPSKIGPLRTFPLSHACVDRMDWNGDGYHMLLFCPCNSTICIRKCCDRNAYLNETTAQDEGDGCWRNSSPDMLADWRPPTDDPKKNFYIMRNSLPICEFPILLGATQYSTCTKKRKTNAQHLPSGSIKVGSTIYSPEEYCGDNMWFAEEDAVQENFIVCESDVVDTNTQSKNDKSLTYGIFLIIGGVCLLLTVAVCLYLPELRRSLNNKIALSHNSSLMVAYFCWGILHFSPNMHPKGCLVFTLLIQFTFMGAFFWLNVMCLDISLTFRTTKAPGASTGGHRFLYYSIYAWGTTLLMSAITLIMEFAPEVPNDDLRPGFTCVCGFNTKTAAILIYLYGPMMIILAVNLVMFVFTVLKIFAIQRQTSSALRNSESATTGGSTYQAEKQRLLLFSKLFLLMGLTWVMEIISWAVGGSESAWYVTDILNLLRGVFIFVLFVCKKRVFRSLRNKLTRQFGMAESKSNTDTASTPWGSATASQQTAGPSNAQEGVKTYRKPGPSKEQTFTGLESRL